MGDIWRPVDELMSSEDAAEDLRTKYTTPGHPVAFLGIDKIYRYYNGKMSKGVIRGILQNKEIYSLMRMEKTRPEKIFTPIISYYHLDLVQGDLVDVSRLNESNDGVHFLLCVIDVFTRFAYIQPLKNKSSDEVLEGLRVIISHMTSLPSSFTTDRGKEFDNEKVRQFLKLKGVKYYASVSETKASLCEIFQKNIQRRLYSYMFHSESLKYIDILQSSLMGYNNTYHRGINMTPVSACREENFPIILKANIKRQREMSGVRERVKFSVGDIVRVSIDKSKERYTRSYQLQNSYQKYEVYKISTQNTIFPKYFLKHVSSDKLITGGYFYSWQLVRCTVKTFRGNIVKTVKDKHGKNQHLFQYKGYPEEFNEWRSDGDVTGNLG